MHGLPDMTVDLVSGLHEHMEATVSVAGESAQIHAGVQWFEAGMCAGANIVPAVF